MHIHPSINDHVCGVRWRSQSVTEQCLVSETNRRNLSPITAFPPPLRPPVTA